MTYPVHGISGFHDHLATHAVVKRVFAELRERGAVCLKRLAFFALTEAQATRGSGTHRLSGSTDQEIDCLVTVEDEDMDAFRRALDCYVTYREMIERTGVRESLDRIAAFEFFQEEFSPPVADLLAEIGELPS